MTEQVPTVALEPGAKVRITQRIADTVRPWHTQIEGEVLACFTDKTGSWYAHGKDGRLWLSRIRLRKADGDVTDIVVDPGTTIEVLPAPGDKMNRE